MLSCCDKWIIGALLGVSILIWLAPWAIYSFRKRKERLTAPKGRTLSFNWTLAFSLCLLGAVWCLRYAVGYYDIVAYPKCEEPLNAFEEFFNSFVHALQTFSMDEDYTEYIRTGKEMVAKGFGGNEFWQICYGAYVSLLNAVSPVVGGAVVLEVLAGIFPELRLRMSFCDTRRKKYYFSELNATSLALAKSILEEQHKKRPVLVFTDTYIDDEQEKEYELLVEAKQYGAICIRKDLVHAPMPKRSEREFYLMDENEFGNLQTLLGLIEDRNLRYLKDSSIYLFVQTDAYIQVERQAKQLLEEKKALLKGGEKPIIVPVRGYRNLVQNLLNEVPLYEPLVGQEDRTDLKVTILGNGIIGTEAFLGAYWMGQMMVSKGQGDDATMKPCEMTINVVSKDTEEAFWSQIDYVNPEIRKTVAVVKDGKTSPVNDLLKVYDSENAPVNAPYCKVCYTNLDLKTGGLWGNETNAGAWLTDSDYYIVALGSDSDNITVAEKLRGLIGKRHVAQHKENALRQVVIAYAVFDSELTETLNREKRFASLGVGKADIYMYAFGNLEQVYSCGNVYLSKNLLWNAETGGQPSYDQFINSHRLENINRTSGDLERYENDNYEYWASLARAMHMKYRLFSLGWIKTSVFDSCFAAHREKVQETLALYRRFAVAKNLKPDFSGEEMQRFLGLSPEERAAFEELERKRECLGWLEHRRWNAFTRTMGYRYVKVTDMLEKGRTDHKNMRLKLHSCLVEAKMPLLEKGESYLTPENAVRDFLDQVTDAKRALNPKASDYKKYDYYEQELKNFRLEETLLQELRDNNIENPEKYCGHQNFGDAFTCLLAAGEAWFVSYDGVDYALKKAFRKLEKHETAEGEFNIQDCRYAPKRNAITHAMKLKEDPFQMIWDGAKTIELRLYDEKRKRLQKGDFIAFEEQGDQKRKILVEIIRLHRFASFEALYAALPAEKCGYKPGEKAHHTDMLAYYCAEEQEKYGVVGIEFVVSQRKEKTQ